MFRKINKILQPSTFNLQPLEFILQPLEFILQPLEFILHPLEFILQPSKSFSLDFSDYSIELVSLEGSLENPEVSAVGRKILDQGIVENGKILNKESFKMALEDLISHPQLGKIKTKKVIFSLPESKSFFHVFEKPKDLKENEIENFVKTQASQIFPFSLEEIYFDYQIKENFVLLAAISKEIVSGYLEIFKILKLSPIVLETESMAWQRLFGEEGKTILICDIGAKMTNLVLIEEGELKLSFSIEVGGEKFTRAISEKLNISIKEAEKIKKRIGLNPEMEGGRIFLILQKEVSEIIGEIKKIESYFKEKTNKEIEKIILIGGSALSPFLKEYFTENLEKEVLIGNPFKEIQIKEKLKIEPIFFSTALGLALRGLEKNPKMAGINLIKGVKL
jgi:type IV pilus assembly protein PilM